MPGRARKRQAAHRNSSGSLLFYDSTSFPLHPAEESMAAQTTSTADQQDVHEEYHSKPVPLRARLGFRDPALVWSGFGIAYICAVIGGIIQQGLGTGDAILAILLGNFILFLYSAAIGYANGKWGRSEEHTSGTPVTSRSRMPSSA